MRPSRYEGLPMRFLAKQQIRCVIAIAMYFLSPLLNAQQAPRHNIAELFYRAGYAIPVPATVNGEVQTSTWWSFMSSIYYTNNNFDHAGTDVVNADGQDVYSLSAGEVVYVREGGAASAENIAVVVKHKTQTGIEFTAIYGHTENAEGIVAGTRVLQGQKIGVTRQFQSPSHLHLGINTNPNFCNATGCIEGWGRLRARGRIGTFVDLETWLLSNPNSLVPPSVLDGVGSLIDPTNGAACAARGNAGCSGDLVELHRHINQLSTGMFQVFRTPSICEQVELNGLTRAYITVRGFADEHVGETESVRSTVWLASSDASSTVRIPLMGGPNWQIVTVTTTQPIPDLTRRISLTCSQGPFAQRSGASLTEIAPARRFLLGDPSMTKLLAEGTLGTLGGVASLLKYSDNRQAGAAPFGQRKDIGKAQRRSNSLVAAQVFRDPGSPHQSCERVRIGTRDQSGNDSSYQSTRFNLASKGWDVRSWSNETVQTTPHIVTLNEIGWVLLRIRTFNSSADFITFDCVS
jgi:hypothetical protein